jgi:hypothetical protein
MKNNLDNVLITPALRQRWINKVKATTALYKDLNPRSIPDENCEALPDGRLRIFVNLPNGVTVELFADSHEWQYRMPQN